MTVDFKKLSADLLRIAEAAAPLVGLSDEVAAGKALVAAVGDLVNTARDGIDSDDHAALATALDQLADKVNARADAVQGRLRG